MGWKNRALQVCCPRGPAAPHPKPPAPADSHPRPVVAHPMSGEGRPRLGASGWGQSAPACQLLLPLLPPHVPLFAPLRVGAAGGSTESSPRSSLLPQHPFPVPVPVPGRPFPALHGSPSPGPQPFLTTHPTGAAPPAPFSPCPSLCPRALPAGSAWASPAHAGSVAHSPPPTNSGLCCWGSNACLGQGMGAGGSVRVKSRPAKGSPWLAAPAPAKSLLPRCPDECGLRGSPARGH